MSMSEFQREMLEFHWEEVQELIETLELPYIFEHTFSIRRKLEDVKNEIERVLNEDAKRQRAKFDVLDLVDQIVNERSEAR